MRYSGTASFWRSLRWLRLFFWATLPHANHTSSVHQVRLRLCPRHDLEPHTLRSPPRQAKAIPIGFQLYTVRGEFSRDVPGTLKKLGQMGYQGVEFWGYGGTPKVYQQYSAADLRKLLDDNGLKCCGIHLDLKALSEDRLKQTIENNRVLGNEYLNVAAAKDKMGSAATIAELAALLNQAAAQCRPHKMSVGYHAHPFDFVED